jgi:hypothetical protein
MLSAPIASTFTGLFSLANLYVLLGVAYWVGVPTILMWCGFSFPREVWTFQTLITISWGYAYAMTWIDQTSDWLVHAEVLWLGVAILAFGGYLIGKVLGVRRALEGERQPVNRRQAVAVMVMAFYVVFMVGASTLAWSAGVRFWIGAEQVAWELVDGVPVLKLTELWRRPLEARQARLPEIILVGIRGAELLLLLPVLVRLAPHLVRLRRFRADKDPEAHGVRDAAETHKDEGGPVVMLPR